MVLLLVIIVVIVAVVVMGDKARQKNEAEKKSRYEQTFLPLKIEDYYIPDTKPAKEDRNFSIGFNKTQKKILFFSKNNKQYSYDYSDILQCEIDIDGVKYSQTSTSNMIGRAALGDVLGGGAGAIMGGATAKRREKETIHSMELKVIVNDTSNPIFKISFLNGTIKKENPIYKKTHAEIEKWHAIVSGLIRSGTPVEKVAHAKSASTELSELFDLKQKGAITEEEFKAHKAKLLS